MGSRSDSCKLIADTRTPNVRNNTRHYLNELRLCILDRPWTLPFPLTQCLLFEMAAPADHPPMTPPVVTPPTRSPPLGEPPRRYHSGPSFPSPALSPYLNDTSRRDSTRPKSFPPRPVFSREGTSCSIASSKTGGLHSRTHSVEFLMAHDRSSKTTSRPLPMPMLQVQSKSL